MRKIRIVLLLFLFAFIVVSCVSKEYDEEVTIKLINVDEQQSLSGGLIIIHEADVSFNYLNRIAPNYLESLAEYGSPDDFIKVAKSNPKVIRVIKIDDIISPNEIKNITFRIRGEKDLKISIFQMAMQSNDGFVFVDSRDLIIDKKLIKRTHQALNLDAGTEKNFLLGGGFNVGQPDLNRGSDNIDNGIETNELVNIHTQLNDVILEVSVE